MIRKSRIPREEVGGTLQTMSVQVLVDPVDKVTVFNVYQVAVCVRAKQCCINFVVNMYTAASSFFYRMHTQTLNQSIRGVDQQRVMTAILPEQLEQER